MEMALVDCKLRVVVQVQQSKIGFSYPRIFAELKLNEEYYNFDCILGANFKMKGEDFVAWWETATPKTISEASTESGINEQALRDFLDELFTVATTKA